MFKNLLSSFEFLETWSILTMILFFASFLMVIIYTIKMDKKDADYMAALPIDENNKEIN